MNKTLLLLSLAVSGLVCAAGAKPPADPRSSENYGDASGAHYRGYFDAEGMPRCLERIDPSHGPALVFDWKSKDFYSKEVFVYVVENEAEVCPYWNYVLEHASSKEALKLPVDVAGFGPYVFSDRVREGLKQLQRGASLYHPERSGAEYLWSHPVIRFDLELNRALTPLYGVSFTTEIYRAWLESQAGHFEFRQKIFAGAEAAGPRGLPLLAARFANRVILLVKGLGHESKDADRFAPLKEDLLAMGAPIITVETKGFGDILKNKANVKAKLLELLDSGKNVILVSLSKGSTESALAIADLREQIDFPRPGQGRLEAYVGFSSVYERCFVADWATSLPRWLFLRYLMAHDLAKEGVDIKDFTGLRQLGGSFMERAHGIFETSLPQSPFYYNVIGMIGGNGLTDDPPIRKVQEDLIRGHIKSGFGANDGFMEYPANMLSPTWATHVQTLVVDGSHAISGGMLGPYSFMDLNQRWQAIAGFFGAILDEVEGRR